ncbi:hypothetical protein BC829DRAFT_394180 [Chytridium lagenaria]|nr:hypothetical protein BC829DRAFT_394180 [Chytridium lagenaria]
MIPLLVFWPPWSLVLRQRFRLSTVQVPLFLPAMIIIRTRRDGRFTTRNLGLLFYTLTPASAFFGGDFHFHMIYVPP